jgi:hypothetical protein
LKRGRCRHPGTFISAAFLVAIELVSSAARRPAACPSQDPKFAELTRRLHRIFVDGHLDVEVLRIRGPLDAHVEFILPR